MVIFVSRFRVPSQLPLLFCHSAAHGLGNQCRTCSRSAWITSLFSPICRSFLHSLICPYALLLVVSRLFCPCSCLHVTLLSLPVPLLPCAAGLIARRYSSSCCPQTLPAGPGISASQQDLHIVYCLCYFGEIKVSPSSTLCIWVLHHPHPDNLLLSTLGCYRLFLSGQLKLARFLTPSDRSNWNLLNWVFALLVATDVKIPLSWLNTMPGDGVKCFFLACISFTQCQF